MCGIAGAVHRRGLGPPDVGPLLDQLQHRGPDAAGVFADGAGAVGQNRLSIIDVRGGDPPLTDESGRIGAVCNGEIYGFAGLQESLRRSGHRLRSGCDTEVIAHLAEDHGAVALARRLDGMFAFAVWDGRPQRLVLGRDRLGKKPLYYWHDDSCLVFGSEIKAVLAHPRVPRSLNEGAIAPYLAYGYVPTPDTFFEGVRSLPPAHVLTFDAAGGDPVVERYWAPPSADGNGGADAMDITFDEAATEVRRLLDEAVRRRLVSDVPLGAFLSGGLDSSAVVGLMAQAGPVRTFTIGFDDAEGFDERPFARAVAERHGTDHTEFVVQPNAGELLDELVWHHDQPFGDSSALPTYLLSQLTREHVTVALCGDGGDELFAGYERFQAAMVHDLLRRVPASVRRYGRAAAHRLPPTALRGRAKSAQRFADRAGDTTFDAYEAWVAYTAPDWRARLLGPQAATAVAPSHAAIWAASAGRPVLERVLDLNLQTYLLDDLLPKVDRMSMAHGLEVRAPLLDVELLEFTSGLPPAFKATFRGRKRVLKRAVADLLPDGLLNRRKRGFGLPLDRWLRTDLRATLESGLGQDQARVRKYLDGDALDELLAAHDGGESHGNALWTLLTLESFLRREGW